MVGPGSHTPYVQLSRTLQDIGIHILTVVWSLRSFSITSTSCSFWSGSRLSIGYNMCVKWGSSEYIPVKFGNGICCSFPNIR